MNNGSLNIVIIGLTISSSWGNGHATTYRSLVKGLDREGHNVTFLEQDAEWYAANRDINTFPHCDLHFYENTRELKSHFSKAIVNADLVIAGSYLKDGVTIGAWINETAQGITAFYDIDTPVTMAKLAKRDYEYITPELIPRYDLYLSFSGGDVLTKLEEEFHASAVKPLYCSVDADLYYPEQQPAQWQLGYLGTYSADRQSSLDRLLLNTAQHQPKDAFVVAGPQYPTEISWPENVYRIEHLSPKEHCTFYNRQRFTLNVTRSAMIKAGFSPSVRLFEAAACGTPIISDYWKGLENFFEPEKEILIAHSTCDVQRYLNYTDEEKTLLSRRARRKVLKKHTSRARARQLARYVQELRELKV
jgi:spore maturation protein CgeB